jgi:hypothetical protein
MMYSSCDIYGCYSGWNSWGRWVALVVIILAMVFLAFLFSCVSSHPLLHPQSTDISDRCYSNRRRRRRGMAPMYGTGWIPYGGVGAWGNKPPGQQNPGYYHNDPYNGGAAPPYEPPIVGQQTGNTFNSNEGYYGHNGYELQQPQSSYQPQRGGDPVYNSPDGPPPRKGDGIIR